MVEAGCALISAIDVVDLRDVPSPSVVRTLSGHCAKQPLLLRSLAGLDLTALARSRLAAGINARRPMDYCAHASGCGQTRMPPSRADAIAIRATWRREVTGLDRVRCAGGRQAIFQTRRQYRPGTSTRVGIFPL